MKHLELIEDKLIAARRKSDGDGAFVTQVMSTLKAHAINTRAFRTTNEQLKKETFIMKLRKLPVALVVAIVFAAVIGLGGISYAAVKVIEAAKPVTVKESHTNQNGKTEITVEKNACSELEKTRSERYELKEGVNLSKEDAAKYINAYCHRFVINERLDLRGGVFGAGTARGTIASITENKMSVKVGDSLDDLDSGVTYYDKDVQKINQVDFKLGDEVLVYRDRFSAIKSGKSPTDAPISAVFKPIESLRYYEVSQQQNIRTIKPCENNVAMDCVVASNVNAVNLMAAQGGLVGPYDPQSQTSKEMQGVVTELANDHFTLENNDHKITFQMPYDAIARYNQTTVYGLAAYDTIYANTNPEILKIAVGDSLSLDYSADANETTIPWNKLGGIFLMVEREPSDISVLRKY